MNRITQETLNAVTDRINRMTGSPMLPYVNGKPQIGCYCLDWAYGGVGLRRIVNDGGGETNVIAGYMTKRELYDRMQAFISGLEACKS